LSKFDKRLDWTGLPSTTPNPWPSDMATQHPAGNKSASLSAVDSTPPSSNNTLVVQNEDISTGDGDGRQGSKAELEQKLKVTFFILHAPSLTSWQTLLVKMDLIMLPVPTKLHTKQGKNTLMSTMLRC